jgi:hypothetical protein
LPECQTPIPPEPPTPLPPASNDQNFRAETSLYAAIPSMTLLYGRNLLDTLHERVGEEFDESVAPLLTQAERPPGQSRLWSRSSLIDKIPRRVRTPEPLAA